MTPLEAGLLGAGLVFFGGALIRGGNPRGLWGSLLLVSLVGGFLSFQPGNFFLLGWTSTPGHTSVVGLAHPPGYLVGSLGGGLAGSDFKFLTLLLLGLAVISYLGNPPRGYEPLLIGLVAVVAGLLTFALDNLVLLYLALELQALSLYTLVGFYKFEEERTDSAVRYLLSGSLVSGFMLLGFARGYGLNGGFHLAEWIGFDGLGSAWVVGVLLFKVGVAPFHFWTPIAYTPLEWGTLALTLGATKVNIWYLLAVPLGGFLQEAWWPAWWGGVFSVGIGSLGGYFQTGAGGLLAYSGMINGGYLVLLALVAPPDGGFTFGYYAGVYFVGTLAVTGVASTWGDTRVSGFSVWGKLGVGVPLLLYYLTLSLAGLPVFPGFFAKLALLKGLAGFGFFLLWGVVVASIVPAVYYVSLAGGALFAPSDREVSPPGGVSAPLVGYLVLGLNGLITLGCSLAW